ncbi:MAG: DEAD/DEAH box helicase, partial [Xanthomonadales bacterium]|nr:DEAD/DEAH box helicase [Xanthomonadales bacterium]
QLERRWAQLDLTADGGVLRVENRIVLLDPKRLEGVKEVLGNRRIPADRVAEFLASPTAFLDAALVNLDLGFSVRVLGVGKLEHIEFGPLEGQRPDWFSIDHQASPPLPPAVLESLLKSPEEVERFEELLQAAQAERAEVVHFGGERIDVSDPGAVQQALGAVRAGIEGHSDPSISEPSETAAKETARVAVLIDEADEVRAALLSRAANATSTLEPDWDLLARPPFPHQREGIAWITGLMDMALADRADDLYRLQGGLLADDMGLGKTYMALVAAAAYLQRQAQAGKPQKPILVVAPLTLLENWWDEVGHTFRGAPFRDIVVLQAGKDLAKYRAGGVQRESVQLSELLRDDGSMDEDAIRYALRIGPESGAGRLDMERRLVLTTYQTLRDYQFSLCRIDWGMVVFDEAQNTKNPNALQTRAAKGLKADFKLLATGTPVENSLGDFWCLVDTVQPGLLGTWQVFREQWIKPIISASEDERDEVRSRIGASLRAAVGAFMLRRIKEDQLKGLPSKTIHCGVAQPESQGVRHSPQLCAPMRGSQLQAYDDALHAYRVERAGGDGRGRALAVLSQLRQISLHPRLKEEAALLTRSADEARSRLAGSGKLHVLVGLLDQIRARGEKVILFMVTKRLQSALKLWLDQIYGLDIAIINGDTKAIPTKGDALSRKQLITAFEALDGFNILIMSPVAAGVGLTVIGANHVVHVERHWNPAKEAQASDRVYRIGQTRDVHIHLPAVTHPKFDSFDVHLDRLLRGKMMLKDAVVTPEPVSEDEMLRSMGL